MISPLTADENIRAACESALFFARGIGTGFRAGALSESERHRLVKASKSPTRYQGPLNQAIFNHLSLEKVPTTPLLVEQPTEFAKNCTGHGRFTVVGFREWSDEYRIRTEVVGSIKDKPPENTGDRVTQILSHRGARKISESCEFIGIKRGGYTTFLTLTLDSEARQRIAQKIAVGKTHYEARCNKSEAKFERSKEYQTPEYQGAFTPIDDGPYCPINYEYKSSLQKEVSRFFDALQKMYARGWEARYKRQRQRFIDGAPYTPIQFGRFRVDPAPLISPVYCAERSKRDGRKGAEFTPVKWNREKLDYLWVAENPADIDEETGEVIKENPHVHVLMRFKCDWALFPQWAHRIERIWGQGMATLEKIKDGAKAGAYMAKAAGYLCKAQGKSDQGVIRGNRYNISKTARAPDWVCVGRYELGRMGFLLAEASEHFEDKFGHIKKRRDALTERLEPAVGKLRHKIGALLEKTRSTLSRMPRISKYQAILKGEDQFNEFMQWAANDGPVSGHKWLPEKSEGDGFQEKQGRGQWLNQFMIRRRARKERRKWSLWLSDAMQDQYMWWLEYHYSRGRFSEPEPANDYLSEYNDYYQTA